MNLQMGFRAITASLILISAFALNAQTYLVDKVVAKVGGEIILLSDIEDQYAYLAQNSVSLDDNAKCEIMSGIISQKIIVHNAKLDSIEVGDDEVEAQLDYRFDNILAQMNGDEEFFKEYYGATVKEMKEKYRADQKEQILLDRMQQSLIAGVNITPSEVKEFFEAFPTDSLPYLNSEVEISELVISPKVNEQERQKSLDKITKIRAQIVEDSIAFEELALKHSMDGTAQRGGDLGYTTRGSFVPEFEAVAYSLKKDEISEIVETEFGFHIIQLLDRKGNRIKARHILIKPEITTADLEKTESNLDSIIQLIRADKLSFSVAVRKHSMEKSQHYHNNGRMKNPTTGNTFFETKDLSPDIYFAIDTMEVGQVTNAIEFRTPQGETMYRCIRLDSRSKPHRANLQEDYSRIQLLAKESKKNEYLAKWLDEKYDKTFIEVDPEFGHCPDLSDWITKESGS